MAKRDDVALACVLSCAHCDVGAKRPFLRKSTFFYFFRKLRLTYQKKSVLLAHLLVMRKKIERNTSKMIKTIAILLGLTAVTAAANTLPPTPEAPVAVLR